MEEPGSNFTQLMIFIAVGGFMYYYFQKQTEEVPKVSNILDRELFTVPSQKFEKRVAYRHRKQESLLAIDDEEI